MPRIVNFPNLGLMSFVLMICVQFRKASPGIEIWTGSQNTGAAGWIDPAGTEV